MLARGLATVYYRPDESVIYDAAFTAQGIAQRSPSRHTPLGITISEPEPKVFMMGRAQIDHKDGKTDEDFFLVNLAANTFAPCRPSELERRYPGYLGAHHGEKAYLLMKEL
jgi:hypothetical protein